MGSPNPFLKIPSHAKMSTDFYKQNQRYSETLRDTDPRRFQRAPVLCAGQSFYAKYARALAHGQAPGASILDVGCGVGQVVRELTAAGYAATGLDVSETSIAFAREHSPTCHVYDGHTLPIADATQAAVGAFNVLEHVDDPIAFLDELTRVLRPGGTLVISSPNFLRVLGLRDYHPHMRGLTQKLRNWRTLRAHQRLYARDPHAIRFEPLTPIVREPPQPDDDAIIATNPIDLRHYLRTRGYAAIHTSCVDRPVPRLLEFLLDATPLRHFILNTFLTARKSQ